MKSLTNPIRHQKTVCGFLLVAFWFSSLLGPRVPSSHAQQTAEHAYDLLELSVTQNLTNHSQALQTAQEALAIFTDLADQAGIIEAKTKVAQYHFALGNFAEAKTLYEQLRQHWHAQQNSAEEAAALLSLSFVEQRSGEWYNALQYLAQAEPLINAQTQPGMMARLANSFAYVYNQSGLYDIARTEYQRSVDYFLATPDNARPVNRMKMLIGYTYVLQGNYGSAATYLNDALATFTFDLDKAQCREYLGEMYIGLQNYSAALEHLETALAIYEAAQNSPGTTRVLALIGQINEQQGALALARTRYLHVLQTFQTVPDRVSEADVNFRLGKLELKARDYDRAESYLKRSLEITEELRRTSISSDLTAAYSETVYERYQSYIDCLIRKHKMQPARGLQVEAFRTSELARARALAELLRDNVPAVGSHRTLARRERGLRQNLSARTERWITKLGQASNTVDPEELKTELAELQAGIAEARREHDQVAEELRKVDPRFDQIQHPTAYSLEQIQREVIDDDQTVLLEYMLGDETSYAWAVRKNEFKFYDLPKQETITKAAKDFYDLVEKEPKDDDEQQLRDQQIKDAAAQLAKLVIDPLARELTARRLIIVADGALHYVPFQLLPSPSNPTEPLVAKYEIVNAPSASILGQLRKEKQQRQPPKRLLAAFGDPVFPANYAEVKGNGAGELVASASPNPFEPWRRASRDIEIDPDNINPAILQPLLFTKLELEKLSNLGGSASFVARGFAASRATLTSLDLSQFSVLHVATHGVLNPKDPAFSGFFLSMVDDSGRPQNGFITTPDIYSLNAPVDLVVLSACRTGLGKGVRGEGLIGLTSGFMHAGASSVAATLWKVDDRATSELMEHFYTNMLEKGLRPADALRAAQNTLRQDKRWQSPHYWAAFTLQGEYQDTLRIPARTGASRAVQNVVGLILFVLLLAGVGWGFWRRRGPRPAVN